MRFFVATVIAALLGTALIAQDKATQPLEPLLSVTLDGLVKDLQLAQMQCQLTPAYQAAATKLQAEIQRLTKPGRELRRTEAGWVDAPKDEK